MTIDEKSEETRALEAALSSEAQRQVIRYFWHSSGQTISLNALVVELFDAENPPGYRERLAARLHHVTLPKLTEAGVIEYDTRSNTVRYRDTRRAAQISSALKEQEVAK